MGNNNILKAVLVCFVSISIMACSDDDLSSFGIFKVIDDNTVEMNGEIGRKTLDDFNELIEAHPNISLINMKEVPGSSDDEVNLQVSAVVHQRNIATHLMTDGLIASGGVDFFLAGVTRTKGDNTMIGVHSWSDGTNEATDYPVGDANHQPYIDYYVSVGFTQTAAEDFYYFTINAAAASSIHYMTDEEIETYNILKP